MGFTPPNASCTRRHAAAHGGRRADRAEERDEVDRHVRYDAKVADALAFLLGNNGRLATVREIASATAYTVAAVRSAADEMAAARFIHPKAGSPAAYLADRQAWRAILDYETPPKWRDWQGRFTLVAAFLEWSDSARSRPLTSYAFGVRGRALLEEHRQAFDGGALAKWSEHMAERDGGEPVRHAVRVLAKWMTAHA
jgi:hypothetical protein